MGTRWELCAGTCLANMRISNNNSVIAETALYSLRIARAVFSVAMNPVDTVKKIRQLSSRDRAPAAPTVAQLLVPGHRLFDLWSSIGLGVLNVVTSAV